MEHLVLFLEQDILLEVVVVQVLQQVAMEEQVVVEKVAMEEPILDALEQLTLEAVVVELEQVHLVLEDQELLLLGINFNS
tara:strand:+ start:348 stop:587 length:240 start_codon:yes stop_codon:yes gene_type:complete